VGRVTQRLLGKRGEGRAKQRALVVGWRGKGNPETACHPGRGYSSKEGSTNSNKNLTKKFKQSRPKPITTYQS